MTRRTDRAFPAGRRRWTAGVLLTAVLSMAQTGPPEAIEQARRSYNSGDYAEAIRLAGEADASPEWADQAAVVLARAHLERFRDVRDPDDLRAARGALRSVAAGRLETRDYVEYLTALGELLFLDGESGLGDRFSAAAEQFEVALSYADTLDAESRDRLFDWWAGALDRQAQHGPESDRMALYGRILTGATEELARDSGSIAASYWLAASASGARDTSRAIGAAAAAWVRAGAMGEAGRTLRLDIERLMIQVILPARALDLARGADPGPSLRGLERDWAAFRESWLNP